MTAAPSAVPVAALSVTRLSKTFPGQKALDDASLEVLAGEVHALVGQNGSGKSTLIKVLAGYHQPDAGAEAHVQGVPFQLGDPTASREAGLRFVHQDLALIPQLNAIDNIAFGGGFVTGRTGRVQWRRQRALAAAALEKFGLDIDLDADVSELAPVERTAVAIARALADADGSSGVLVLDEPTASLPGPEVQRLHEIVGSLTRAGKSVIYVSHRLDDVFETADRVTVLREGGVVGTHRVADITMRDLTTMMVGRAVAASTRTTVPAPAEPVSLMEARHLSGRTFHDIDLSVAEGEVLGIAGVLGSGRDELAAALSGSAPPGAVSGELLLDGRAIKPSDPVAARRRGVSYVPPDRKRQALVEDMDMRENLTLGAVGRILSPGGRLSRRREVRYAREWADRVGVVPPSALGRGIKDFSGGNQQKAVIGRALTIEPRVLVLAEPTAGVDIGAREALYELIREEGAGRSLAVVVASTDTQDLVALCHRVVVMRGGELVRELRGDELTALAISHAIEGLDEPDDNTAARTSGRETQHEH